MLVVREGTRYIGVRPLVRSTPGKNAEFGMVYDTTLGANSITRVSVTQSCLSKLQRKIPSYSAITSGHFFLIFFIFGEFPKIICTSVYTHHHWSQDTPYGEWR